MSDQLKVDRSLLGLSVIVLLGLVTSLDAVAIDMYLPAMPAAALDLKATPGEIQQTLSLFLFGLAAGHAFYGPLTDRLGRRLPLLAGLIIFCIGSAMAASTSNVDGLLAGRLVQALGAAGGLVIPRAIVHDLADKTKAPRIFSLLMQMTMIGPLLGPIIGGAILRHYGWYAIFWALFTIALFALLWSTLAIPESLDKADRKPLCPRQVAAAYFIQLSKHRFMAFSVSGGLLFGAITVYLNMAPFVLIGYFKLHPSTFGLIFAGNALGIVVASQIATVANRWLPTEVVVLTGMIIQIIPPLLLSIFSAFFHLDNVIYLVTISLSVWLLGLPFGGIVALAMAEAEAQVGVASALMGLVHYSVGALIGVIASFGSPGLLTLPLGLATCAGLAALCCYSGICARKARLVAHGNDERFHSLGGGTRNSL